MSHTPSSLGTAAAKSRRRFFVADLPWVTLIILAASLALQPFAATWQLETATALAQPWRLLSGHLVHWNATHLLWDALVFAALSAAAEAGVGRRRVAAALLLAALAGSATFLLRHGDLSAYRGLSGLDSALLALVAVTQIRTARAPPIRLFFAAVLIGFVAKTATEIAAGHALFAAGGGWVNLPSIHLAGALAGAAVALTARAGRCRRCSSVRA